MAFALVAHVSAGSSGGTDITTGAIDTTGANLIVVHFAFFDNPAGTITLSDSKGNTWNTRTEQASSGNMRSRLHDVLSPTVGSGHTFTATNTVGANKFCSINVLAFSGATTGYDVENGASATSASTINTGSLTASENSMVFVTGVCFNENSGGAVSIDSSFTLQDTLASSAGNHLGGSIAYLIQTSAGTVNPQWNVANTASDLATTIANYKDTPSGGGGAGWGLLLASGRNRLILQG